MKILVTGGAGYIGSHTCVELLNNGYDVVVVDNLINSQREVINRIEELTGKKILFYQIDLLNKNELEKVFIENSIDVVMHLAGLKAVGESIQLPLHYYHNNIVSTLVLCELMQKYNVKKMVFSSSATVYGAPLRVPIDESSQLKPTNPYGRSKLMIEKILQDLITSDPEWRIVILRYFNPIGAHESGKIGESPTTNPNNLMPYLTQVAVGNLKELKIYGNDYQTVDGTGVRDYIHVVDLAKGHVKAAEKTISSIGLGTYNLGTGTGFSVLQVIKEFEKITKVKIPYFFIDRRPGDVAVCYANTDKANSELCWVAEKGLSDMCLDAWRWQKNNPLGY